MRQEITELTRALGKVADGLDRLAQILTEKGEKEKSPYNPLKGKGAKRNPPIPRACACEGEGFDRLFDEFWAKYPKECPRKVGKAKCRAFSAPMPDSCESASRTWRLPRFFDEILILHREKTCRYYTKFPVWRGRVLRGWRCAAKKTQNSIPPNEIRGRGVCWTGFCTCGNVRNMVFW